MWAEAIITKDGITGRESQRGPRDRDSALAATTS